MIPLGEVAAGTGNETAPLANLGGKKIRTPDFHATQGGNSVYWEVKYRTRARVDSMTGIAEHWMSQDAFDDYLVFAQKSASVFKVILYEDPVGVGAARWLEIDIRELLNVGRKESRYSNSGQAIDAWVWPVSSMKAVDGPNVLDTSANPPLLPEEGDGESINQAELTPLEKNFRTSDSTYREENAERAFSWERMLEDDPVTGLDLLRRSLGIPKLPKYSVLKIGAEQKQLADIMGLLHYGIRVFLVTSFDIYSIVNAEEISPFIQSRILEWAMLPSLKADEYQGWVVDGVAQVQSDFDHEMLARAEQTGGINYFQYRIIHADAGKNVLVTAGAGTGKTETLSERIVFLLSTLSDGGKDLEGNPTEVTLGDMVLMTFTREAANEIRKRISSTLILRRRLCRRCVMPIVPWLLDLPTAQIGTIHGYAKHLLQKVGSNIGLTPNFKVSNSLMEFRKLLHVCLSPKLKELFDNYDEKQIPAAYLWEELIESVWEFLGNNGWYFSDAEIDWGKGHPEIQADFVMVVAEVIHELGSKFLEYCSRNQFVPTGQLVPKALESITRGKSLEKITPRFVFVDEFQDTDSMQMDFILELQNVTKCNLYVVGDAKQGIYRFRGAEGSAFSELTKRTGKRDFEPFELFALMRNFRSDSNLLDSLHIHFQAWGDRGYLVYGDGDRLLPDPQRKSLGAPVKIKKVGFPSIISEVEQKVKKWRDTNSSAEVAILCRNNWQAVAVRNHLISKKIPCELSVKGNFFQSPVVTEFRVLLEAMCNPGDRAAILELLETRWADGLMRGQPPPGMNTSELQCWSMPITDVLSWRDRVASFSELDSFLAEDLENLGQRILSLFNWSRSRPPIDFLFLIGRSLSPETKRLASDIDGDDTETRRYRRGWDHLVSILDSRFGRTPTTIPGILNWIKLQIATNSSEDEPLTAEDLKGRVTALTVHKAKGLEFEMVLIPHTETTFLKKENRRVRISALRQENGRKSLLWNWQPSVNGSLFSNSHGDSGWSIEDDEVLKEEARLLYVAMTRAKHVLEIFTTSNTDGTEMGKPNSWQQLLSLEVRP